MSSWLADTFVNSDGAEDALCADRSGFLRNDLLELIPIDIRKHIIHPDVTAHIAGFQKLFNYLNTDPNADYLRQHAVDYFNDQPFLRGHLRERLRHSGAAAPPFNKRLLGKRYRDDVQPSAPATTPSLRTLFDRLKPVAAAAYDCGRRNSCFRDTRALLLSEIQKWANNSGSPPIYVLYGVAGIGKSTVAKTVAERAVNEKTLGASFFFSRDEDNRKTLKSFFTTLAYQLSCHYPNIAEQTNTTLEEAPEVAERDPAYQFDCLIAKPLRMAIGGMPILVVIDALDECDEDDAEVILSLLAQEVPQIPCLRVFITARPERHIRSVFEQDHNHHQFHLHDIDQFIVEADIRSYLEFRLSVGQVQKTFPSLRSIWQSTEEQMNTLVAVSGKLFNIAATAASFILDPKQADPGRQLAVLLNSVADMASSGSKPMTMMDGVYMGIINAAQPHPVGDWIDRFQACVGTIVLLYDLLPCDALAELTGIDVDDIARTLSNLHSLFAPSGNSQTFRVHHKSFPDFM